jgi:hypothetical protein
MVLHRPSDQRRGVVGVFGWGWGVNEQKKPEDLRVAHVFRISRMEFDADPSRIAAMSERRMREAIAHFIQNERVETKFDDHFIEKRIDLYVATPQQFWELIHQEAQQIAMRWGAK